MLRSPAEQAAYEKSLHPGLLEGWNGGLNLGFAVTRGNSETKNLNIGFQCRAQGIPRQADALHELDLRHQRPAGGESPHHRELDRRRSAVRPRFFSARRSGL